MKRIIYISSSREYSDVAIGTMVYQYADGSFLPDSQQPKPQNPTYYHPHISTRYKNIILGSNSIPLAYNSKTQSLVETDKLLPELYNIRENCCGCTACYSICPVKELLYNKGKDSIGNFGEKYDLPHGAIYMEEDEEGFLYPVLDASLCIRCYKCIEICPIKKADLERMKD